MFQSQAIHGIAVSHFIGKTFQRTGDIQVLIWGGWSVCIIQIPGKVELDNQNGFKISILLPETQADDWLLDACIASYRGEGGFSTELDNSAILVTAHNDLLGLRRGPGAGLHDGKAVSINYLVAGPRSILYSAHLYWLASNRVLVAAGTVYGEVLLWSVDFDRILHHCSSCVLHYSFTGHEGSVFGVRISEELSNNGNVAPRRILASCSDDRTIKIWDISSTTSTVTSTANSTSAPCLASAMGHASRIWGIRFLHQDGKDFFVVSFGEDASVQMWRLSFEATIRDVNEGAHTWNASLTHRSTFKYHSGKNIWSAAVLPMCDGSYMVCTGGADGCIVCFRLSREAEPRLSNCWLDNWTTTEVFTGIAYPYGGESDLDAITAAKNATGFSPHMTFLALEGSWKIVRNIKSAIIGQSSGIFEGTATFKKRPPTDVEYDAEYVYTEGGHFTSETGLSFAATRSYVYRFHGKNNSISVWFVKPIEGEIVDYLFHTLDFDSSFLKPENDKTPKASGYHKCGDDDYRVNYTFQTRGIEFNVWNIKYDVKGPKKDYVTNAQHTRNSLNPAMAVRDIPDNHKVEEKADSTEIANLDRDTFNAYSWISNSEFLVSTTQGRVLLGSVQASAKSTQSALTQQQQTKVIWKDLGDAADLKSYSIITSVKSLGIAYVVGPKGVIRSYNHPNGYLNPLFQLDGKAAYLRSHLFDHGWVDGCQGETRPLRIGIIASCIDCLIINLVIVSVSASSNTQSIASTSALDRPPRFLVTSSCFIDSQCTLALGSRDGRIAIYSLSTASMRSEKIAPCHVQQIHGWDAVTSVEELPCQEFEPEKSKTFILTTGRDGTYAIHLIERRYWNPHDLYFDFQTVHQCTLPFGPNIEGAHFDLKTQDILLWGFRNKDFTVWNETRKKEIMTVECGGAHRNWAFSLGEGGGGGILAWTQASRCNLYSQPNASHLVIQHGSHGREIKAVAVCPCPKPDGTSMQSLLATGAEDTRIRISACSAIEKSCINPGLVYLAILDRHTTGIQQLRWSSDGRFLFSAAGCEEFFVWRVRPVRFVGIGVRYEARCPSVTESSDLRIMDFTVDKEAAQEEDSNMDQYLLRMVYSDSSIRVSGRCSTVNSNIPLMTKLSSIVTAAQSGFSFFVGVLMQPAA